MERWAFGFPTPNILGALAAMAVTAGVAIAWLASASSWTRRRCSMVACGLLVAAAGGIIVVGSASKGAAVAACGGMLVTAVMCWHRSTPLVRRAWACTIGVAMLAAIGLGVDRWHDAMSGDVSTAHRLHSWRVAAGIIADHPWSGIGGGTTPFAIACTTMADLPPVLAGRTDNICGWALNDVLDLAAKHGLPAAFLAICVAGGLIAVGVSAARDGRVWRGVLLVAIASTWALAGMFSCIWFADTLAAILATSAIATCLVAAIWPPVPWARALRLAGMTVLLGLASTGVLWMASSATSMGLDHLLRGERSDAWTVVPHGQSRGTLVWSAGDEDIQDVCRHVLRPMAADGWTATVRRPGDASTTTAHPDVVLLHRPDRARWEQALADVPDAGIIAIEPIPPLLSVDPDRSVCVVGTAPAWLGEVPRQATPGTIGIPTLSRIWITRFPEAWPSIRAWIAARHISRVGP